MLLVVRRPVEDDISAARDNGLKTKSRYPREGERQLVVSTEIVGLGLIGFSVNCLMVVFNTIGIEKKDTDKLGGGWGLAHLSLGAMMVLVGVATFMNDPVGGVTSTPATAAISGFFGLALVFYGFFWVFLGASLVRGADLRPIGHVSLR